MSCIPISLYNLPPSQKTLLRTALTSIQCLKIVTEIESREDGAVRQTAFMTTSCEQQQSHTYKHLTVRCNSKRKNQAAFKDNHHHPYRND